MSFASPQAKYQKKKFFESPSPDDIKDQLSPLLYAQSTKIHTTKTKSIEQSTFQSVDVETSKLLSQNKKIIIRKAEKVSKSTKFDDLRLNQCKTTAQNTPQRTEQNVVSDLIKTMSNKIKNR